MSESDAEYYASHRDDEDEWGEPVRRKPASRRLASMISVRFTPDEAEMIRAAAANLGESVSNFVRDAAIRKAQGPGSVPLPVAATVSPSHGTTTRTGGGHTMSPVSGGRFVLDLYTGTFIAAA